MDESASNPHPFSAAEMQARQGKRALPTGSLPGVNNPRQAEFDTVLRREYAAELLVDESASNPHPFSAAEMQARQGKRALPTGSLPGVNNPRQAEFDTVLRREYAAELLVDESGLAPESYGLRAGFLHTYSAFDLTDFPDGRGLSAHAAEIIRIPARQNRNADYPFE